MLAHLAAAQQARGQRVQVLMPPRLEAFQNYLRELGVPVVTERIAGKLNPTAPGRILALARQMGADVIHSHLSSASMHSIRAARKGGIPIVAHIQALSSPRWYGGADLILVCSRAAEKHVRRLGLKGDNIRVLYDGIPLADAARLRPPQEVRRALGIPADAPVVGSVAALIARKGHAFLLQAARLLTPRWPNLHLVLVGSGPLRGQLARLAQHLNLAERVHLLGWRDDKLDLVRTFDVVAIPSVAVDGFSMTALEAAQFGIPAVASNWPGIDEAVLHEETGLLVPPSDPTALAHALDTLLADDSLRHKLGQRARARVLAELTMERMAENLEEVYRSLVLTDRPHQTTAG
ncbi:MAG: glycosyltransferase [Armatimonadetes bacterium]|nr:glycosyltransferase [Armatimonadota bacterium]